MEGKREREMKRERDGRRVIGREWEKDIERARERERNAPEIRINQIGKTIKQNYISHWKTQTKTQSKMQFYLALNRNYTLAPYLTLVTDKNLRTTLTKYRLSEHSLAIEVGRHRQTWLPKENRLCPHCE